MRQRIALHCAMLGVTLPINAPADWQTDRAPAIATVRTIHATAGLTLSYARPSVLVGAP
jgi:hypothetical protein